MDERVRELLAGSGRRGGSAVVAGAIAGGERVVASWAPRSGPRPDGSTVFEIGSLTKAFTGALLADMHLRGEVHLADPLGRHLPHAGSVGPRVAAFTLAELATHRTGLPNTPRGMLGRELAVMLGLRSDGPWPSVDERAYRDMVRRSRIWRPVGGRGVRYSSLGYGLLGDALAARAGRPFGALLRERVLAPLGLEATAMTGPTSLPGRSGRGGARPDMEVGMAAAGAARSTADDMLRWLGAHLHPPAAAPGPALAMAQRPWSRAGRMALGFGWLLVQSRKRPPFVWHGGGTYGFRSFAAFVPGRDVAVVVLRNAARSVDRLGLALLDAALDRR